MPGKQNRLNSEPEQHDCDDQKEQSHCGLTLEMTGYREASVQSALKHLGRPYSAAPSLSTHWAPLHAEYSGVKGRTGSRVSPSGRGTCKPSGERHARLSTSDLVLLLELPPDGM